MESFRTEDIHALLMTANLPHDVIADDRTNDSNPRGEMFASISSSLMERFRFDSSLSDHSSLQLSMCAYACCRHVCVANEVYSSRQSFSNFSVHQIV
ncbi:hypothetical protein RR48_11055 [Papilio machaon]|uniref:Uncharacterized protein n=1 Tax=Papilio machaon TaxID=76193 RepID=A0A194RNL3_PAPMA|nr:hypothetical protein RR48_11055 [Papilio machaon]